MKFYASTNIRNVAVVGHGKTGKTSLLDACLYRSGAVKRQGSVDAHTSVLDYEPEEAARELTIGTKLVACEWKDYKINFLDTPGYPDFIGEVQGALQAADTALIVVSAASGVEVGTEKIWRYATEADMPRAFFVNKMDRERADYQAVIDELRARFGNGVVPVQIPVGAEAALQGVADLLSLHIKIVMHDDEVVKADVPEYMADEVEEARQKLIESVADFNNELLEKYVNGDEITEVEVEAALIEGIQAGKIFPVFVGSAKQNIGIHKLMNGIVEYLPSPYFKVSLGVNPEDGELKERRTEDSFSAQVFRTVAEPLTGRLSYMRILSGAAHSDMNAVRAGSNPQSVRIGSLFSMQGKRQDNLAKADAGDIVVTTKLQNVQAGDTLCDKNDPIQYEKISYPEPMLAMAVDTAGRKDEDKILAALAKEQDDDPTIVVEKDPATHEDIVRGIGEVQLEILREKLARKYKVNLEFKQPSVAYREAIRQATKIQGRYKKQTGGHGQFGDVWLELSPQAVGSGNEFTENIFGGSVPRQFIPAVEKGVAEALEAGVLAGYPLVDVKVNLYDGSYHPVDSSEASFKAAAAIAIRKGIMNCEPYLLEPIYTIKVTAPEYYLGNIMGRLSAKRARILGTQSQERDFSEVSAEIPASELYKFATELRSLTQDRGSYTQEFTRYAEVPANIAQQIVETYQEKRKMH